MFSHQLLKKWFDHGLTDMGSILNHLLVCHDIECGDCGSCSKWMTTVGKATRKDSIIKGRSNLITNDDSAQWNITAINALSEDNQIRFCSRVLIGKPFTRASKARHDFIGNPFDSILITECAYSFEISSWRNQHSSSSHH